MKKQDYQFFVSQKVTMWIKEKHIIEAESKEQAIKIMLEDFDNNNEDTFVEQEFEYDTIEDIYPEGNGLYATRELYYDDDETKLIAHNGEKEYQFSNNTKND
jgi:hypothetical protein